MYAMVFALGAFATQIKDKKNILFSIFFIVLALLAFFRYGVGADYFSYQLLFERINPSIFLELKHGLDQQEALFRLLGSLLKNMGFTYQQYLIFFSVINLIFVAKTCRRYSLNPILSLFLYFCYFYFVWTYSAIRQGITIAIGVYYLLRCIEEKATAKLIVISVLLSFVHASALVLIFLYFVNRLNLSGNKLVVISGLSLLISVLPLGPAFAHLSNLPFMGRVAYYFTDYSILSIFGFPSVARIVFLLIGLVHYNFYISQNSISKSVMDIYVWGLNLYFVFKFSELTASRLSMYGFFLSVIVLTNIYTIQKRKINKLIYLCVLLFLSSLYFLKELNAMEAQSGLVHNQGIITPYTHIFTQDADYYFTKAPPPD